MSKWVIGDDRLTVVNAETGVAYEARKDPTRAWVIRCHAGAMIADLLVLDGADAEARVVGAFRDFTAWITEGEETLEIGNLLLVPADPASTTIESEREILEP